MVTISIAYYSFVKLVVVSHKDQKKGNIIGFEFGLKAQEKQLQQIRDFKNVKIIKSVSLDMNNFDYTQEVLETLYEESLEIYAYECFSENNLKYLENFISPFLTSLTLNFDDDGRYLSEQELLQISKCLNLAQNLNTLYLKFQYYEEEHLKPIYQEISKMKNIKNLSFIVQPYNNKQKQNHFIIENDLVNCVFLQVNINELSLFSTFKNAKKLNSVSLILNESNQQEFDKFMSQCIPNLLMIDDLNLELMIYKDNELLNQFQSLIMEKLYDLDSFSVKFYQDYDLFRIPLAQKVWRDMFQQK